MEDIYAMVRNGTPIRIAATRPLAEPTEGLVARLTQFWQN
jgi:hypothetical protein